MDDRPDVSFALPCYNESEVLRKTVTELVDAFKSKNINVELVLVDNGSTDNTGEIINELAREGLPVSKVEIEVNEGYGNGVLAGLAACRGKHVGFICADGQVQADDVVKTYSMAANGNAPRLVKVRRRFRMDGFKRKFVSICYNVFINMLFPGLGSIDINGNPKILPRETLEQMSLQSKDWFVDAEVMIKAKRLGVEVLEFNVLSLARIGGSSNVQTETCLEFFFNLLKYRFGLDKKA